MKQEQFFAKLTKDIVLDAEKIQKHLESAHNGNYVNDVMGAYFGAYWKEFKIWWFEYRQEQIDWITFGLAPHNSVMFIQWVFKKYPNVRTEILKDLAEIEAVE